MPWGVYVHIPWCRHHCPYCAFVIDVRRGPPHAAYTDAVLAQWATLEPRYAALGPPTSVYFGGGTPSEAPPEEIARLVAAFAPAAGAEVTLEANPGGLGDPAAARARLAALRAAGVTRLSLGVQSFQPRTAGFLGRAHDAKDARVLVEQAQAAGFASVSFDLIFAVPGQTPADLEADLDATLALAPDHVSLYGLSIEPGTPLARRGVQPVDDDAWRAGYDRVVDRLGRGGIERYEVSNFARGGHRSHHNEHYWRARPWAGLGPGAHGWTPDHARTITPPDVDAFLAGPTHTVERPPPELLAAELIGSTLRHVDGLDRALLRRITGLDVTAPEALLRGGALRADDDHLRLSADAFAIADAIGARLCATLRPADPTR